MHYGKAPLTDTVSMQELYHMRDELHMSNREIAERLGVGYSTIASYLGRNPNRSKRKKDKLPPIEQESRALSFSERLMQSAQAAQAPAETLAAVRAPVQVHAPVEEWEGGFKVVSRKVKAESATSKYYVDCVAGTVNVVYKRQTEAVTFTKDELDSYIRELMDVLDLMEA